MNIIVLVKQVPATESMVEIDDDGRSVEGQGLNWIMNPYDEIAVEEALKTKEKQGGTVTVISLGKDKAAEVIRTALAMGADKGVLITGENTDELDQLAAARILAAAVSQMPFDLVFAGVRSVDTDGAFTGPAVAELLDIPHVSSVVELTVSDGSIQAKRTVEGGTLTLDCSLPALVTAQRGLNEPRYASLPGMMKAKKKTIEKMDAAGLVPDLAPLARIEKLRLPDPRKPGKIIGGQSAEEKAANLAAALEDAGLL